jgi:hypothetical protein
MMFRNGYLLEFFKVRHLKADNVCPTLEEV